MNINTNHPTNDSVAPKKTTMLALASLDFIDNGTHVLSPPEAFDNAILNPDFEMDVPFLTMEKYGSPVENSASNSNILSKNSTFFLTTIAITPLIVGYTLMKKKVKVNHTSPSTASSRPTSQAVSTPASSPPASSPPASSPPASTTPASSPPASSPPASSPTNESPGSPQVVTSMIDSPPVQIEDSTQDSDSINDRIVDQITALEAQKVLEDEASATDATSTDATDATSGDSQGLWSIAIGLLAFGVIGATGLLGGLAYQEHSNKENYADELKRQQENSLSLQSCYDDRNRNNSFCKKFTEEHPNGEKENPLDQINMILKEKEHLTKAASHLSFFTGDYDDEKDKLELKKIVSSSDVFDVRSLCRDADNFSIETMAFPDGDLNLSGMSPRRAPLVPWINFNNWTFNKKPWINLRLFECVKKPLLEKCPDVELYGDGGHQASLSAPFPMSNVEHCLINNPELGPFSKKKKDFIFMDYHLKTASSDLFNRNDRGDRPS